MTGAVQNTSHAVMAQRHEPHDSLDDFPTPPWATRALVEKVISPRRFYRSALAHHTVWEPAANRGHMVRPLREYFGRVFGSDIHDYGGQGPTPAPGYAVQERVLDFLLHGSELDFTPAQGIDWIITNPRVPARPAIRRTSIGA